MESIPVTFSQQVTFFQKKTGKFSSSFFQSINSHHPGNICLEIILITLGAHSRRKNFNWMKIPEVIKIIKRACNLRREIRLLNNRITRAIWGRISLLQHVWTRKHGFENKRGYVDIVMTFVFLLRVLLSQQSRNGNNISPMGFRVEASRRRSGEYCWVVWF